MRTEKYLRYLLAIPVTIGVAIDFMRHPEILLREETPSEHTDCVNRHRSAV
jgi:hypothetical protein